MLDELCWLLKSREGAHSVEAPCSAVGPVGPLHPVQGLLERFEAGPGCASRERGNKETHVIAVGTATNVPENKVTVLIKPLSPSTPPRPLHLLLSSRLPVSWWLEAERLPPNLPVLVQLSSNSSVCSNSLRLHVHMLHRLPFRPHELHRWALKHHGNLSSLTHTTRGNRVYISQGEDPQMPDECHLQSMFVSHNYMASDLQQQDLQGCASPPAGGATPEVHVIKLHAAGSGLCGSLQVEVIVSLVPLVNNSMSQKMVLILSSPVPVSWAITAHGVRGHISVHSSNSVSPPYPPEPGLSVSSTLNSDLSTLSDILIWARENGYTKVTSYTEADLANRFVIWLAGGGTGRDLDVTAVMNPQDATPPWVEEDRLRQWLHGGGRTAGGRESFSVRCDDGRLNVAMDLHILQSLSVPVAAVTLGDSRCQARSNGSHFLLAFPITSCGTEALLLGHSRGMQYKNMVLFWKDDPPTILALNETERKPRSPFGINFSCLTAAPAPPGPAIDASAPQSEPVSWASEDPALDPELSLLPTPRHRSGPLLVLKLFVTESYEQGRIGPCVISADQRLYVEISAKGPFIDVVEVKSCVVSPLSDPKRSHFWTVISDGCSSDPSLTLMKTDGETKEAQGELEEKEGMEGLEGDADRSNGEAEMRMRRSSTSLGAEENAEPLRFSFILRPVFNNSMQFLHCSLHLCASDPMKEEAVKMSVRNNCQGRTPIPPLISRPPKHQCEIRNLSRPMVVTQPLKAKLLRPTASQRPKRLSVTPVTSPDTEHSSSLVQTGVVTAIVFTAFVVGVTLMGGLWCICSNTAHQGSQRDAHLTDRTHGISNICSLPSLSDQSTSCV
ncbi:transforming growth factor beta receptor type 3 [Antennarius striatus]|uniref:transforming growth factor beta receptor type 3 n=1 Tax=Antennarius striatus TaxID=241820 RepID=UPI0035B235F0